MYLFGFDPTKVVTVVTFVASKRIVTVLPPELYVLENVFLTTVLMSITRSLAGVAPPKDVPSIVIASSISYPVPGFVKESIT